MTGDDEGRLLPRALRWLPLALLAALAGFGWWTHASVETVIRQRLADALTTLVQSDVAALRLWIDGELVGARAVAHVAAVRSAAVAVAQSASGADRPALLAAPDAAQLRDAMVGPMAALELTGWALVGNDDRVLASSHDEHVGYRALAEATDVFARARRGDAAFGRPFPALVAAPQPGVATLFVAAPVRDDAGAIVAVLGLRLDPTSGFGRVLQVARPPVAGQTFAFDAEGRLLTEPAFTAQLRTLGLLAGGPGTSGALGLQLRDPGVDLVDGGRPARPRDEQPLTHMVQEAVAGRAGVDVDGYRDVRGVEVVGAWDWLPDQGFGVAVEVDRDRAWAPLALLRRAFAALIAVLLLAGAGLGLASRAAFLWRRREHRALRSLERLGQYTLDERIGEGGMGVVWRAHHVLLRRPTAVKLLLPERSTPADIARFEREVHLTSRLSHPNTVAIWDYGRTPEGLFYYAMEFLDGLDLRRLVRRWGPLPPARVLHVLVQACESLREAHELGLVHRDIKPGNLMLCRCGGIPDTLKVVDFGIVKAPGDGAPEGLLGTPAYMAPEAVRCEPVDARADLYALGATAYFLLTATDVFKAPTPAELLQLQLHAAPELPSARAGRALPADLERIVMACLEKLPDARPASAAVLAAELAACEDAGEWTRALAEAWWREHPAVREPAGGTAPAPELPRTLSVDLDARSGADA
ncbi:MAG TPA: serine/threonine protein kinase [Planctomycetota bacterium]|nr:serine/threonine protein kinase [Planctomycetota bacterium]